MALVIILRKHPNVNRFRDLMIDVISSGLGNNALLCSGFFQEDFHGHNYRASQERNFAQVLRSNKIELTTVGVHNWSWKQSYKNFRNNLVAAGVKISAKYMNGLRWHAKVFILSRDDNPIFGIVGSSNITRRAFSTVSDFNYECDTVIWPDSEKEIVGIVEEYLGTIEDPYEVIRAPYDVEQNRQLTVQDRLTAIKSEILEANLRDLE